MTAVVIPSDMALDVGDPAISAVPAARKTNDRKRARGPWLWTIRSLRSSAEDPAQERTGVAQLTTTVLLVTPVWAALAVAALSLDTSTGTPSRTSAVILAILIGQLALGAAVLSSIRAWVGREIAPALAAAGLCVYALGSLAQAVSTSIGSGSIQRWFTGASLSLALGLLFLSVASRRDDRPTSLHRFIWAYPLLLIVLTMGFLPGQNLLVGAAWALTGTWAAWTGNHERERLKIWIGCAMLCLAQGRLALAILPSVAIAQLGNQVLQVVATTLILFGTIRALQESIGDHKSQVLQSLLAFQGSEARRISEEHAHQEAVHNLRSALGAITVATHALVFSGKSASLSEDDRTQLSRALDASLERARTLISREWASVHRTFPLLDLVMPAVVRERSAGIAVDVDVAPEAVVRGDRGRAAEVLETILDNARRYAGGTRLTIRAIADDPWVTLIIGDRGPGIPVDCLDRIFERGWTTSCGGEGAGIGLHVAKLLMEEQGGTLRAANRSGGGAVFLARFQQAKPTPSTNSATAADPAISGRSFSECADQGLISV